MLHRGQDFPPARAGSSAGDRFLRSHVHQFLQLGSVNEAETNIQCSCLFEI